MPEAYQVHQGPDYLGFARTMIAGLPDTPQAESRALANLGAQADIAGHLQSIRSMAEKLAEDQQEFPLKLARSEMATRLLQGEVRSYEIEHAPDRLRAAADLKMQEDQRKLKSMQQELARREGADQFNSRYAPDLMKAIANGNTDEFARVWSSAASDPNSRYMIPEMMKMKEGMTDAKKQDFETKMLARQEQAMSDYDEMIRLQTEYMTPEAKEAKKTIEKKAEVAAFGKPISEMTTEQDLHQALMGAAKLPKNQNNPVAQLLGKEIEQPGFLMKTYGPVISFLSTAELGRRVISDIKYLSGIPNSPEGSAAEALATKEELNSYMKLIQTAPDEATKERARDALRLKLENIGEAHLVRTLAEQGNTEATADRKLRLLERMAALELKQRGSINPALREKLETDRIRATRGGAAGYRTVTTDAMGQTRTTVRTPLAGGASGGGGRAGYVHVRPIGGGETGWIPEANLDTSKYEVVP